MKWEAAAFARREIKERKRAARNLWHRRFAWLPVAIPEQKFESIVVHRHWLWLEPYAAKTRDSDQLPPYTLKSYAGEPTLTQIAKDRSYVRDTRYTAYHFAERAA